MIVVDCFWCDVNAIIHTYTTGDYVANLNVFNLPFPNYYVLGAPVLDLSAVNPSLV